MKVSTIINNEKFGIMEKISRLMNKIYEPYYWVSFIQGKVYIKDRITKQTIKEFANKDECLEFLKQKAITENRLNHQSFNNEK